MSKITKIHAREILDSRGHPTVETTVILENDVAAISATPSGASTGTFEAMELRDNDPKHYGGLGVLKAVNNINTVIAPALIGKEAIQQQEIDKTMIGLDATPNKSRLGANAIIGVSMAVAKAQAKAQNMPLYAYISGFLQIKTPLRIPVPLFNVINGGKHAGNNVNFQEYIIIPASSKTFPQALELGFGIYSKLREILVTNSIPPLVGDEGGFAPRAATNIEPFKYIVEAAEKAAYRVGFDVFLGLDAAANSFLKQKAYEIKDKAFSYSDKDLIEYYVELMKQYPLLYLEDPLAEEHWEGWTKITEALGSQTIIVGDDLTVTNQIRLQTALQKKTITGIIIKPNQVGTITETLGVVAVAKQSGLKVIVSHRSGETNDDFIADFAVGVQADYAKLGAPVRGERVAKYNRLLAIYEELTAGKS
jgi:enolase